MGATNTRDEPNRNPPTKGNDYAGTYRIGA